MKVKHIFAGIATAGTVAVGGTIAADRAVNPYTDNGAKFEITAQSTIEDAGEVKTELAKDHPAITLSKWNGEAGLTVSYDKVHAPGARAFLTDRMEWKGGKEEVHAYPIQAKAGMEDGGFEIEVVLNDKPDTNVFQFKIEGAEDLDFFYQPELKPEEIAQGALRPENVVGSYAVYYRDHANHMEGQTNYATGKAYHIYRPKAVDANGAEIWAELHYSSGLLFVTVPFEFLQKAAYPIRVDPTFGYTTQGASNSSGFNGMASSKATYTGADGTGDSMSFYGATGSGSANAQMAVYKNDNTLVTNATTNSVSYNTLPQWRTANFTSTPTFSSLDTYFLYINQSNAFGMTLYYDSTSGTTGYWNVSQAFGTWPSSITPASTGAIQWRFSIYVTYTASGGGGGTPAPAPSRININSSVYIGAKTQI